MKGVISRSRGSVVLVDESAKALLADHGTIGELMLTPRFGCGEVETAVGSVLVVVLDVVVQDSPEVATAVHQGPVSYNQKLWIAGLFGGAAYLPA